MRSIELVASELACIRGGRTVFAGLRFGLVSGEALLVTGPNGAGKSSLLRLIAGLVRASAGRLTLAGGDADASVGEQAHYLGHQDALKPALTVAENLTAWVRYLGGPGDASQALDAIGLGGIATLPAAYLSAGQRRRLSLARLIAIDRPLWLLDEPTASLDGAARTLLATLMRNHLAGGGLILAATHEPLGLDGARELRLGGAG
jgi:heme exporter protein A